MLTVDQSKEIEKLQRNSLKVIDGPNISYAEMLDMFGLEWLPDRRLRLLDNFAKKAAEDPKYPKYGSLAENFSIKISEGSWFLRKNLREQAAFTTVPFISCGGD